MRWRARSGMRSRLSSKRRAEQCAIEAALCTEKATSQPRRCRLASHPELVAGVSDRCAMSAACPGLAPRGLAMATFC